MIRRPVLLLSVVSSLAFAAPTIEVDPKSAVSVDQLAEVKPGAWDIVLTNSDDEGPVSITVTVPAGESIAGLLVNLPDWWEETYLTVRGDAGPTSAVASVRSVRFDAPDRFAGGERTPTTRARLVIEGLYAVELGKIRAHEIVDAVVHGDITGPVVLDRSALFNGGTRDARLGSIVVKGDVVGNTNPDPMGRNRITVHGAIENMTVHGSMGSSVSSPQRSFALHCIEMVNLRVHEEMRGQVDTTLTGSPLVYGTGELGVIRSLRVDGDLWGTAFGTVPGVNAVNDAIRTGHLGQGSDDLGLFIGDDLHGRIVVLEQVSRPISVAEQMLASIVIEGHLNSSISIGGDVMDSSIEIAGTANGEIEIGDDLIGDLVVGGDLVKPAVVRGNQYGQIQIGDALEGSLDIDGTQSGDLDIGGGVTEPVTVQGDSTGQIHIGGGLKDVLDIGGNSDGAITIHNSLFGALHVGGDLRGALSVGGVLRGEVGVAGDVFGDISLGTKLDGDINVGGTLFGDILISVNEGLEGQIIINTENDDQNFWAGRVTIGDIMLGVDVPPPGTAPGYTVLSTDLGGGAVGLARFDFHKVESSPKSGSRMSTPPAFAELVFYGPVDLVENDPLNPSVIVERAPALAKMPWGCTSPCDPGCGSMMGWTDISDQFTATVSGRIVTVTGLFDNGHRYRVRSPESTGDRIVCVGVSGSPTVRLHAPNPVAGCTDDNYIFSVEPVMALDLSGDGQVTGEDLVVWAETPTDVDQSETADIVDLVILADAVE